MDEAARGADPRRRQVHETLAGGDKPIRASFNIRETDVAARLGGDEFAIILEEVDETQAQAALRATGQQLLHVAILAQKPLPRPAKTMLMRKD